MSSPSQEIAALALDEIEWIRAATGPLAAEMRLMLACLANWPWPAEPWDLFTGLVPEMRWARGRRLDPVLIRRVLRFPSGNAENASVAVGLSRRLVEAIWRSAPAKRPASWR